MNGTLTERPHRSEDYLRTVNQICSSGSPATLTRIARQQQRSIPTVSETLDRLVAQGMVSQSGRVFFLTTKGRDLVQRLERRHRYAELLLTSTVGAPPDEAHQEADSWVHAISERIEQRLAALFPEPGACPFLAAPGSGAASKEHSVPELLLSDFFPRRLGRIERFTEETDLDARSTRYLVEHGFVPGAPITLETRAPDGTLLVTVGTRRVVLGADLSTRVLVVPRTTPARIPVSDLRYKG